MRKNSHLFKKRRDFHISTYENVDCESLLISDKKEKEKSFGRINKIINLYGKNVDAYRKKNLVHTSSFFYAVYAKTISLFSNSSDAFFISANNGRSELTKSSFGTFVKSLPFFICYSCQVLGGG